MLLGGLFELRRAHRVLSDGRGRDLVGGRSGRNDCWIGVGRGRCGVSEEESGTAVVVAPVLGHGGVAGGYQKTSKGGDCLLYTSPSPRDRTRSRMPSSA